MTMPNPHETTRIASETERFIRSKIAESDVVLFMKGTPDLPMCGFSARVARILTLLGVPFTGVNVLEDESLREGVKIFSRWPTVPQLYVKGEFLGGCDIVQEMFERGELASSLADKGLEPSPPSVARSDRRD